MYFCRMEILYDESWSPVLKPLLQRDFMKTLFDFVETERQQFEIYPAKDLVFNAFCLTPLPDVKVVILVKIGRAHV